MFRLGLGRRALHRPTLTLASFSPSGFIMGCRTDRRLGGPPSPAGNARSAGARLPGVKCAMMAGGLLRAVTGLRGPLLSLPALLLRNRSQMTCECIDTLRRCCDLEVAIHAAMEVRAGRTRYRPKSTPPPKPALHLGHIIADDIIAPCAGGRGAAAFGSDYNAPRHLELAASSGSASTSGRNGVFRGNSYAHVLEQSNARTQGPLTGRAAGRYVSQFSTTPGEAFECGLRFLFSPSGERSGL